MIDLAAVTDQDRTDALAITIREEIPARLIRLRDTVTYTAREYGMIQWLYRHTQVTVNGSRSLTVSAPAGRTAEKFGYLLSALIDHATSLLQETPVGIDYREGEISSADDSHTAVAVYAW